jgi:hypothetical protein
MFHLIKKLILLAIIIGAILFFFFNIKNTNDLQNAINQATTFIPPKGKVCGQSITYAVHSQTGATFTFPTTCLPDGWEVKTT